MKKIFLKYIPLMLGLAVAFSSCSDDDDNELNDNPTVPKPQVEVVVNAGDPNQASYEVEQNKDVTIYFTAQPAKNNGAKLDKISLEQSGNNAKGNITMNSSNGKEYIFGGVELDIKNADNEELTFGEKFSDITNNVGVTTYSFTITDKDGLITTTTFDIDVVTTTPFTSTKTGEVWHILGLKRGSWSLTADAAVGTSNAEGDADISNIDDASTGFTGSFKVGDNRLNTDFVKAASSFDYDAATKETAKTAYNAGNAITEVTSAPIVGDVYIYNLGDGSYTAVKITKVDPLAPCGLGCNNKGKMEFEYKK